jgi:ADP-ribose pyrophosphatase
MKKKFDGRLIKVFEKKTVLPNSHKMNLEIVKHPGAVLIVPYLTNKKIVLLRQYRPVIDDYMLELPAGTLAKNEKPGLCAKRELLEETGYKAKYIKKIGKIYPCPGYSTEKITFFLAQGLEKAEQSLEKDEVIEIVILTKTQIKKLFKQGKIVDAKTICALSICGVI